MYGKPYDKRKDKNVSHVPRDVIKSWVHVAGIVTNGESWPMPSREPNPDGITLTDLDHVNRVGQHINTIHDEITDLTDRLEAKHRRYVDEQRLSAQLAMENRELKEQLRLLLEERR